MIVAQMISMLLYFATLLAGILQPTTANHPLLNNTINSFPYPRFIPACGPYCRESGISFTRDAWQKIPENWGPSVLHTEIEIAKLGPYVAPILYGGLGNILFQLAALHVYGLYHKAPVIVGYFQHWNREFVTFDPWGGHRVPGKGITLKNTFPSLLYTTVELKVPRNRVANQYAFELTHPDEYLDLPARSSLPIFIHGYFFNHRYWHAERNYLLRLFRLNPAVEEYVSLVYGDLLSERKAESLLLERRDTVSVHFRLGYTEEPAKSLLSERTHPESSFFAHVFTNEFNPESTRYLIFSDNIAEARRSMAQLASRIPRLLYEIIDEDVVHTLAIMKRCKHHLLTSSTLSFWGAYLDPNQPYGGRTILHPSFYKDHGKGMIPPEFGWEIMQANTGYKRF